MRGVNLVLGVGLGLLWYAGLRGGGDRWLTWLDLAVALAAIAAGLIPTRLPGVFRASDVSFGVILVAVWLLALTVGAAPWLAWWTFGFGVAFLVAAVGAPGIEADEAFRPSRPSRPSQA